jgi:hypothetical protein
MRNSSLYISLARARQRELLDEAERARGRALMTPRRRITRRAADDRHARVVRATVRAAATDPRGC